MAEIFDFFFFGLVGGVDANLEEKLLFIAADVPSISMLLAEGG